ncbi:cyclic nucleotide-binding domain-containing protein [Bdellovibrio sp. HCB337]|uniref:cyclic nucleotide-binding domain-containing protein n=1 Tax=Bdellovibrio sp. HCB337 TaxID=3394358 RepID=UPI0039A6120F
MARNQDKNVFLIVSGNANRITALSEILSKNYSNCSIFHAADWFDTKYKIDNVFPKVVIIDEYLPKVSGLEVVAKTYKEKNYENIHIVIMSVVADHDMYPANGRIHYLTEPEREHAVLECLAKIVAPKQGIPSPGYTLRHLNAGDLLFKEGDSTEAVYIVKNGTLKAYSDTLAGGRVILGEIGAGEFVGEMGHFNADPRSATVEAVTEVDLVEIPLSSLDSVIFSKPSWARALVKTLSHRLKRANKVLTG